MASPTLKVITYGSEHISSTTILIIHGGFSSHAAFIPIARLLESKGYHVLLPDLPAHGSGSSGLIQPFRSSTSVSMLADLIRDKANDGKAHLVGLSLGAYVALGLAAHHPDLVHRLFCTGAGRNWNWSVLRQGIASRVMYSMDCAPTFVENWFTRRYKLIQPPELIEDSNRWKDRRTLALYQDVIAGLGEFFDGNTLDRVKSPVLFISASAHDPIKGQMIWKDRLLKGGCPEVRAVELKGYPHAWDARDPDLFAESIIAWVENEPLPSAYEDIV